MVNPTATRSLFRLLDIRTSALVIALLFLMTIGGVWELYAGGAHKIHLLSVFVAILCSAMITLVALYFADRVSLEEARLSKDRFGIAMAAGRAVAWNLDVKTGQDEWSGDLQTIFGIPANRVQGQLKDFYQYVHPEDRSRVAHAIAEARDNHTEYATEYRILQKDGAIRWVSAMGKFHYAKGGDPLRMLGIAFDITDRKLADEARIKSEEKFSKAFFSSPMAIAITSTRDHRYIDVNNTFERLSGWRRDEVLGRTPFDINLWVEPSGRHEIVKNLLKDGQRRLLEFHYRRKDGEQRVALGSAELIEIEGEACLLGVSLDITETRKAEEALRVSEERFSKVFRSSPMSINLISMRDHRFLDVNEGFEQMSGWNRDDVIGRTPLECNIWVDPSEREQFVKQISTDGFTRNLEFRFRRKDGEQRVALGSAELIQFMGEPCLISACMDVTEHRRAEQALHDSEQRFRRVVEHIGDAVIADDLQGRITFANDRFLQLFGFTRAQLNSIGLDNYIAPEYRDELVDRHRRRMRGEDVPSHFEYEGLRTDGTRMWLEVEVVSITDGEGHLVGTQSAIRDITERKRNEQAIRESEERLRNLIEASYDWVYEMDRNGTYTYAGPQSRDLLGYEPSELIGKRPVDFMSADDVSRVTEFFQGALKEPKAFFGFRSTRVHKEGHLVILETNGIPIFDKNGAFCGYRGMARDITERTRAEEALRESEERFRRVVEHIGDALAVDNVAGRVIFANDSFLNLFGFKKSEIPNIKFEDYVSPEYCDEVRDRHNRRMRGEDVPNHLEYEGIRRDGVRIWLEAEVVPIRDREGNLVGSQKTLRDVTERKRAEIALRESEERFRLVANTAPVMIWMCDPSGSCTYVNKPWLDFTGRNAEGELGEGWKGRIHPDDLDAMWMKSNEGFERRQTVEVQYRVKRHDGEYRWILDIGVPRFDSDGTFAGYIGSCIDITERKLAEEAMASMGRRLIEAHEQERTWIGRELHDDINQRLALLAVELDRLKEHQLLNAELQEKVSHAQNRIGDIAKDIQALSHRLHSSKLEYLGLATAASSFCREFSQHSKIHIDFTHEGVPRNLPQEVSLCLFRVLQEALQNALKYSGVRNFTVDLHGTPDSIELRVADTGIGFEEQDAFIQQGLGLISMRERLQLVHGEFSVKSKPGAGTTIYARVPLIRDDMRAIAG